MSIQLLVIVFVVVALIILIYFVGSAVSLWVQALIAADKAKDQG